MNKRKKFLYALYSLVFIGICIIPVAAIPFSEKNEKAESKPPSLINDGDINTGFSSELESYISENIGLHDKIVTLNSELKVGTLNTSPDNDVIAGKDGWLFYNDTADDFMNINTLSDRAVYNIYVNLSLLNNYCADNGADFLFTVAPNKNSIYPEYMPYNMVESNNEGNYEKFLRIYDEMSDEPENSGKSGFFVDLRSVLRGEKNKSTEPIYHKTDTHWNNSGALAARNALIKALGKDDPLSGFEYASKTPVFDWKGDLAEMLYPSDIPYDLQIEYNAGFTFNYVGRLKTSDDMIIKTVCDGQNGHLLMYRDSFGRALIPFMAQSFASAEFSRAVPYRTDSIASGETDTVILEIAERNIGNLQKNAPVMPAPEYREIISSNSGGKKCKDLSVYSEISGNYTHIYGVLGEDFFLSDRSEIYVTLNGKTTYQAFNASEDSLPDMENRQCDTGFSLYIPQDKMDINDIENIVMTVVSQETGESVSSDTITDMIHKEE